MQTSFTGPALTLATIVLAVVEVLVLMTIERHKPGGEATLSSVRRVVAGLGAIVLLASLYFLAHETDSRWIRNLIRYVPARFGSLRWNIVFLICVTAAIGPWSTEVRRGLGPTSWEPHIARALTGGGLAGTAFGMALLARHGLFNEHTPYALDVVLCGTAQGALTGLAASVFWAWCFRPCFMPDD
jgi:hypothetical protein